MIVPGPCWVLAADLLNGVHRPGDEYALALYGPEASIGPETERYTADGEVFGDGYAPGGAVLTGRKSLRDGRVSFLDFDDAVWENATISAAGALLYNRTRGTAIAVFLLPEDRRSVEGPFTVRMPAALRETALVRVVA